LTENDTGTNFFEYRRPLTVKQQNNTFDDETKNVENNWAVVKKKLVASSTPRHLLITLVLHSQAFSYLQVRLYKICHY